MTFHADGDRLIAGNFNEDGLNCNNWNKDANDNIGFFLLMLYQEKDDPYKGRLCFLRLVCLQHIKPTTNHFTGGSDWC